MKKDSPVVSALIGMVCIVLFSAEIVAIIKFSVWGIVVCAFVLIGVISYISLKDLM
jgi:hypothetical protein